MALTALKGKRLKKRKEISRRRGTNYIPVDKGWESTRYYFQTEVTKKDIIGYIKIIMIFNHQRIYVIKIFFYWRFIRPIQVQCNHF